MKNPSLWQLSNELADTAAEVAASVVQVRGHRRPGTGLVYADGVVLTTVRTLGREDGLHVTRPDGGTIDAELVGWDPATNLALLRAAGLGLPALAPGSTPARVGHLALAIARITAYMPAALEAVSESRSKVIMNPFALLRRRGDSNPRHRY